MELFLQATAAAIVTLILALTIEKQGKDIAILLTAAVCCMIGVVAVTYFSQVIGFLRQLQTLGNLNSTIISSLLRILGIGLITELSAMVCTDAGNSALSKALEFLGAAVSLALSVPIFTELIELVQKILLKL